MKDPVVTKIGKTASDELDALAWAAQKAGQTYGQFRVQVTPEMLTDILCEYRAMKQKQRDEEAARLSRSKKKWKDR